VAEPRRVRTQAERDADDHAWRQAAQSRPGYATWPNSTPGSPSWWLREANPTLGIPVDPRVLAHAADGPPPADGERCAKWCGFCDLTAVTAEERAAMDTAFVDAGPVPEPPRPEPPVRRRWWHRYTRRSL